MINTNLLYSGKFINKLNKLVKYIIDLKCLVNWLNASKVRSHCSLIVRKTEMDLFKCKRKKFRLSRKNKW